jgi:hypothetical protein
MKSQWKFYIYDVWGNSEDGFEVNNIYGTDKQYDISDDISDSDLVAMVFGKEANLVEIDSHYCDETAIGFNRISDGKPIGEIRKV